MTDKTKLGKYEILEELGRGGFGVVYMAKDSVLQRSVAVKVLHPALLVDTQFIERFKNEARVAAVLDHPNLVHVYDFGQEDGQFYLVMAYMPGGSLSKRLKSSTPFPTEQVIQTIREIGAGLAYAHDHKIIHRDLKPSNILFDDKGIARVSDMGFAKLMRESSAASLTASGQQVGTPSYMAPEIWKGKPATIASDIYSLACICIEMFTGKPYFGGETTPEIILKHFQPRDIPAEIPPGLRSALAKALAEKPEERYTSIPEFLAGLEQIDAKRESYHLGFAGSQAGQREHRPPEPPSRAPSQAETKRKQKLGSVGEKKNHRVWVIGAVIGALLLILGVLTAKLVSTPRQTAAIPLPTDTPVPSQTHTPIPTKTSSPIPTNTSTPTLTPEPTLGIGSILIREKDDMTMVYVPAGKFELGSKDGNSNGQPVHTVDLSAYWIDKYEVSNAQYTRCVATGSCTAPHSSRSAKQQSYYGDPKYDNYPVIYIDWDQASTYCQWAGGRLPTEAEWEKAARGTDGRFYPWENGSPNCVLVNYNGCLGDTSPVDTHEEGASPYGALNMAGNVWEWTWDWYSSNLNNTAIETDSSEQENYKIYRGGAWISYYGNLKTTVRKFVDPTFSENSLGFRCVLPQS